MRCSIPEEAIVSEGLRQIVYPVKDNKVERRVIPIGQRQSGKVEVLEGLRPGETIVVLGVQRVRPGAEVIAAAGRVRRRGVAGRSGGHSRSALAQFAQRAEPDRQRHRGRAQIVLSASLVA